MTALRKSIKSILPPMPAQQAEIHEQEQALQNPRADSTHTGQITHTHTLDSLRVPFDENDELEEALLRPVHNPRVSRQVSFNHRVSPENLDCFEEFYTQLRILNGRVSRASMLDALLETLQEPKVRRKLMATLAKRYQHAR